MFLKDTEVVYVKDMKLFDRNMKQVGVLKKVAVPAKGEDVLNRNNFEIAKLCPKEDEHAGYAWHGIRVTPTGTTVTEGHVLLQVSGVGEHESFDPFILTVKAARKIADALPVGAAVQSLNHAEVKSAKETKVVIEVTNTDLDVESYSIRPVKGQFPDVAKAVPAIGKATMELCRQVGADPRRWQPGS